MAFHCMQIPAMKERDGYIGLKDLAMTTPCTKCVLKGCPRSGVGDVRMLTARLVRDLGGANKGRFTVSPYVLQVLRRRLSEPVRWYWYFSVTGRSFRRLAIPGLDRVEFEYSAGDSAATFVR